MKMRFKTRKWSFRVAIERIFLGAFAILFAANVFAVAKHSAVFAVFICLMVVASASVFVLPKIEFIEKGPSMIEDAIEMLMKRKPEVDSDLTKRQLVERHQISEQRVDQFLSRAGQVVDQVFTDFAEEVEQNVDQCIEWAEDKTGMTVPDDIETRITLEVLAVLATIHSDIHHLNIEEALELMQEKVDILGGLEY